jgi:hypothetical protein
MPRSTIIQTDFSGGELSPRLFGRVNLPQYQNAVEIMQNALPVVQGGCMRRYGTSYVQPTKNTLMAALIPFVVDIANAYMLEVGDFYIRVFKNGAYLSVEIPTPYAQSVVNALYYCQGADTMIFFHQSFAPQRLRRFSDILWVFDACPIDPLPFSEIGDSFATTLTLSLATVGTGRTATAGAGVFLNSDVGRTLSYQGGFATITGFTSATVVTITINTAFQSVNLPSGVWTLGGTPQETITPSAVGPVGTIVTLTASALNTWRSSDVGKYVEVQGGLLKITIFTSALVVSARIIEVMVGTTPVAQPALAWTLKAAVWGGANGYPRCGTFFQQRLCAAGTPAQPQTLWGSTVGAYFDFTIGPLDSDAFEYTLASDQVNPIVALAASTALVALTPAGEFVVRGGVEKPLTPTNVQVDNQTNFGAAAVRPVRYAKFIGFVQRAGLKFRSLVYDQVYNSYDAPDVTFLSEHVSRSPGSLTYGFLQLAYQQEPDPLMWCRRADGVLATLTTSESATINAWARQFISGAVVSSVAVIPAPNGDQTWFLTRRNVGGVTVQYLEIYDSSVATDCSIALTSGSPQTVWGGLSHLEGQTVSAYVLNSDGSGIHFGDFVVTGGSITLANAVSAVRVGIPFTALVKMLTPEAGNNTGSAQGNAMRTSEITVRLKDTATLICNGKEITGKKFGSSLLDQSAPAVTGLKRLDNLGFERGVSDVTFTSSRPFPFHILSVIRKFTVND